MTFLRSFALIPLVACGVLLSAACSPAKDALPLQAGKGGGRSGPEDSDGGSPGDTGPGGARNTASNLGGGQGTVSSGKDSPQDLRGSGDGASAVEKGSEDSVLVPSEDEDVEQTSDCVPQPEDTPDDDFVDTNCDGIDGDVKKAIFVSPEGDDLGHGTMLDPVRTINVAVDRARDAGRDVYICNGSYEQNVILQGEGVSLYGGYDCKNGWKRVADRAKVTPKAGIPFTLREVSAATVERVAFIASDVREDEQSSIAGLILRSQNVTLRRVEFVAGKGGDGLSGEPGTFFASVAQAGKDGGRGCESLSCDASGRGSGSTSTKMCPDGLPVWMGGAGGDGATLDGKAAESGEDAVGEPSGKGGPVSSGLGPIRDGASDGEPGETGSAGSTAPLPQSRIGTFVSERYVPSNRGGTGTHGERGGAGGGGAGGPLFDATGGLCCIGGHAGSQGGFGGCGGYPGHGGGGGGGSFGVVAIDSQLSFSWVRIIAADGGRGGDAGAGGRGQTGGKPGAVYPYGDGQGIVDSSGGRPHQLAGLGGPGGKGGLGGHGSPGGGGPSLGLALVNSSLELAEEIQVLLGNPGFGGAGVVGADAPDGVAAEGYDFTLGAAFEF